ncbi:hypothetical protein NOF04DRAFT_11438 [Fusarium oxysporum II5]|nr:uncharacterized protein FOIG_12667 [Fusarium odoratissimum NRRL 54006]EXL94473.1 hypothetical protein FOIG_12667 [Fusarium odoratissimum NRRL 54006]KAK2122430.1 hypothetical protein NOF04DRAFT_11438 [Fusarium oxysporum II5]
MGAAIHHSQRRVSCEACRNAKAKCQRIRPTDSQCARCFLLKIECIVGKQRKVGRPRLPTSGRPTHCEQHNNFANEVVLWTRETGVVENSKHSSVTLTPSYYNDQASLLSPESSFADSLSVFGSETSSSEASSWQETIPDEGASSTWDTSWELDLASLTSGGNASSHRHRFLSHPPSVVNLSLWSREVASPRYPNIQHPSYTDSLSQLQRISLDLHLSARVNRLDVLPIEPIPSSAFEGSMMVHPCKQGLLFTRMAVPLLERMESVLGTAGGPENGEGLLSPRQLDVLWIELGGVNGETDVVDALIIGAGPAGLSAALALARQLHTAVVFNSSLFRNARSEHMHTIPTWDHKDPAAFRGATRKEILERYNTISFKDCEVAKVEKTSAGDFAATAVDGTTFTGRRVLLASGVTDLPLDIQGYDQCWGRSIYHCLFCHGYEDVGKPSAGILALGEISSPAAATALARSAKQITSKVVIYTSNNPGVQTAIAALLGQNNTAITTNDREIASLALGSEGSGIIITFADGSSVEEAFLAHKPPTKLNGPFAEQLGVELTPGGDIQVTPPFGATSVKGVYAAGDCAAKMKNVMQAMHMGAFAGVGMAHDLQAEGPRI